MSAAMNGHPSPAAHARGAPHANGQPAAAAGDDRSHVDVLIVGAGPAGLMSALALARAGVRRVRIVDKRPCKVTVGHADGIQPRTIEVFQSYGIADRLLAEGCQMHLAAFYNPSPTGGIQRTSRAPDFISPTARYPFKMTLSQGAIEDILLDALRAHGVHVERPCAPIVLAIDDDVVDPHAHAVTVVLQDQRTHGTQAPTPTETVRAKYVIGADGAHSWVRKTLGIGMDGESTDFVWGVLDTVPVTDFPDIRNRCAIHAPGGSIMVVPREGDLVRLYVQLPPEHFVHDGRVDMSRACPDRLLEACAAAFAPFKISFPNPIEWWTLYIIGQRVASKFSKQERVFIAGDACHTHSPKAGQGMNASMNDAHNLGWKLAHVLHGWADPSLLKTYELERRKYAQELIDFDKKYSYLFSGKPRTQENTNGVSHEEFFHACEIFAGFTSGIGIHYPPSAIVDTTFQHFAPKLEIGQRMIPQVVVRVADGRPFELQDLLPADARFKILIFPGDISDDATRDVLQALAEDFVQHAPGFLEARQGGKSPFDMLTICANELASIDYTDVPSALRTHWSKVLTDDVALPRSLGGRAYASYGIGLEGAIVVVRPDGYVGFVCGMTGGALILRDYFARFARHMLINEASQE